METGESNRTPDQAVDPMPTLVLLTRVPAQFREHYGASLMHYADDLGGDAVALEVLHLLLGRKALPEASEAARMLFEQLPAPKPTDEAPAECTPDKRAPSVVKTPTLEPIQ